MADLIDREAIAHKIAAFASTVIYRGCEEMITGKDSCNPAEWTRGYEKGVLDTAKIILGQPTIDPESLRKKGEWISVAESLPRFSPEKWRKVFVTIEDERGVRFTSTAKYDERYQQWYEFSQSRFFNEDKFRVVAWMECPAPYCGDDARGEGE